MSELSNINLKSSAFCTCCHLNEENVSKAARVVNNSIKSKAKWNMSCTQCNVRGDIKDKSFLQHFSVTSHKLVVRLSPPELFCIPCMDYQYHHSFDALTHRNRNSPVNIETMPLGIVNLGNTCFMSSVLQPLFANPILLRFFEISECFNSDCLAQNTFDSITSLPQYCIFCELQKLYRDSRISLRYKNYNYNCRNNITLNDRSHFHSKNSMSVLTPSNLLYAVWNHSKHIAGYEQKDAHEFLIALLDGVTIHLERYHGDVNRVKLMAVAPLPQEPVNVSHSTSSSTTSNSNDLYSLSDRSDVTGTLQSAVACSPPPSATSNTTNTHTTSSQDPLVITTTNAMNANAFDFRGIINEAFSGVLCSALTCLTCSKKSVTFDPFVDISVSINDISSHEVNEEQNNIDDSQMCVDDSSSSPNESTAPSITAKSSDITNKKIVESSVTLEDCLKKFTSVEVLNEPVYCEKCKEKRLTSKQLSIRTPPNILIIHVKRFVGASENFHSSKQSYNGSGNDNWTKNNCNVLFPLDSFDIAPYINPKRNTHKLSVLRSPSHPGNLKEEGSKFSPRRHIGRDSTSQDIFPNTSYVAYESLEVNRADFKLPSKVLYDLQGVVCHKGVSLSQGHYISYVRTFPHIGSVSQSTTAENKKRVKTCHNDRSSLWTRCDDAVVLGVEAQEVADCQGYILIYIRKQINFPSSSLSSSSSSSSSSVGDATTPLTYQVNL